MAQFNPNPNRRDPLGLNGNGSGLTPATSLPSLPNLPAPPHTLNPTPVFPVQSPLPSAPEANPLVTQAPNISGETDGIPDENLELWDPAEDGDATMTPEDWEKLDALYEAPPLSDEEWVAVDAVVLATNEEGTTPLATLFALVHNENPMVREALALSPHTTAEVLAQMGEDSDPTVQFAVMNNSNTSETTFRNFAFSTSDWIIMEFVDHPRTTREMLLPMIGRSDIQGDDGFTIRMSLLESPKLMPMDKSQIPPL